MRYMKNQNVRDAVRAAYSKAARKPRVSHPFPVGSRFARSVGYSPNLLKDVPKRSIESFTGVSNVSVFAEIDAGTVLDLGCGAGLDAIVGSRRIGDRGLVVGIDFSPEMIIRARQAVAESGLENIDLIVGGGEDLPVADRSIDVAMVNGIFNLNPYRDQIFRELARVVKPGGRVWSAEIILREALADAHKRSEAAWFA